MNFEFSDETLFLRDQARDFLRKNCTSGVVREVLDGEDTFASGLWDSVAEMGWLGAAIPEEYGGAGFGYEGLCVLAEELGRAVAPIPFSSSIYLAAEAIMTVGTEEEKKTLLPQICDGSQIWTFALAEGFGHPSAGAVEARIEDGRLSGEKWPVPDGSIARFAIVVARDESGVGLYRVDLRGDGVETVDLTTVDPTRNQARLAFSGAPATRLGAAGDAWAAVERVLERASILFAFEQIGGAEVALMMARDHSLERYAFGRPIATFQALKHKLADVYVALELARSNCYYGCWALSDGEAAVPIAAAGARVAAIHAYYVASKENIQVHGGAGFTWEYDCQLFYRRSKYLSVVTGGAPWWRDRLITRVQAGEAL